MFSSFDPCRCAGYDGAMSYNTFGQMFRVTTFGESHGPAIGCVVDGCPPNIRLTTADIQRELDRRRPGQSRFTTQRREPDTVRILSGVFTHPARGEEVTTGTPIGLMIENIDQRSKDYAQIRDRYRPGFQQPAPAHRLDDHQGTGALVIRPALSSRPSIRLRFCTACPA